MRPVSPLVWGSLRLAPIMEQCVQASGKLQLDSCSILIHSGESVMEVILVHQKRVDHIS